VSFDVLVQRSPGETRYALLSEERVLEVVHHRDHCINTGEVWVGRAGKKAPAEQGIFVDIGVGQSGLLEMRPPYPAEGKSIAVEIAVPARPGKSCILLPVENLTWDNSEKLPFRLRPPTSPVLEWSKAYGEDIRSVLCEPRSQEVQLKEILKSSIPAVQISTGSNIFSVHGVDEKIELSLRTRAELSCGGNVVIEETAACVTIDVNAGPASPQAANREALAVIAEELRFRNIAGHILIDAIPAKGRSALPRLMSGALKNDRVNWHVAGLTPLGMIELTRQRGGLSLREILLDSSGVLSVESIGLLALRSIAIEAIARKKTRAALELSPIVKECLQTTLYDALSEAESEIGGSLQLRENPRFDWERVELSFD